MKNYGKENLVTMLVVMIITFLLTIIIGSQQEVFLSIGNLALFIERIIATSIVIKSAKSLGKGNTGWGFATFFFPIITLIVMNSKGNKKIKMDYIMEQSNN